MNENISKSFRKLLFQLTLHTAFINTFTVMKIERTINSNTRSRLRSWTYTRIWI